MAGKGQSRLGWRLAALSCYRISSLFSPSSSSLDQSDRNPTDSRSISLLSSSVACGHSISDMASSTLRRSANATISSISTTSSDITRTILNLPHHYSEYVASNSSSVSNIESSLRSLSYLLPGARLHDSELASESLHTFVQLLSIYHDTLLKKRSAFIASSPALSKVRDAKVQKPKPSLHAKYTTFWTTSSSLYTQVATSLKVAEYIQLLCETGSKEKRRGKDKMEGCRST